MSSEIAIKVENLSKCYQIYDQPHDRLKQSIYPRLQRLAGKQHKQYFREFLALRNISFEIKKGETVGIIGRNGSGKSTLLQIICGTLTPTSGSVETRGRVAALLELGSGFNPEFTGRENVYMNAAVLGLSIEETDARFADIIAFADIGDFIEQPVKTYSSGMMVRLAFAVAISVDPKILIVDEALSVGDELFQRKCFARIETIKKNGATILFVSHSGATVVELCDRAVLLDSGEKLGMGYPKQIVSKYQKLIYAPQDKRDALIEEIRASSGGWKSLGASHSSPATSKTLEDKYTTESEPEEYFDPNLKPQSTLAYESHGAHIELPEINTLSGRRVNCLKRGNTYLYTYNVRFEREAHDVRFGMLIKAKNGTELGGIGSAPRGGGIQNIKAGEILTVAFHFECNLLPGLYFINAGCNGQVNGEDTFLYRIIDALVFRVLLANPMEARAGYIDFATKDAACLIEYQ